MYRNQLTSDHFSIETHGFWGSSLFRTPCDSIIKAAPGWKRQDLNLGSLDAEPWLPRMRLERKRDLLQARNNCIFRAFAMAVLLAVEMVSLRGSGLLVVFAHE